MMLIGVAAQKHQIDCTTLALQLAALGDRETEYARIQVFIRGISIT
jgi:hypothetical protein